MTLILKSLANLVFFSFACIAPLQAQVVAKSRLASDAFATISRISVQAYAGDVADMERDGYTQEGGACIRDPKFAQCRLSLKSRCMPYAPAMGRRCIWAVGVDASSLQGTHSEFEKTDALQFELPRNYMLFDTSDVNCASRRHPGAHVLAVGLWKWNAPPRVGGYAYALKRAWIVDTESRHFIAILPKYVSCTISEDRN